MHKNIQHASKKQDKRLEAIKDWLIHVLPEKQSQSFSLTLLPGDASHRRYLRMSTDSGESLIVVDSPPNQEDNRIFIQMAHYFAQHQITVPRIIANNLKKGFMLVTDFGNFTLFQRLLQHKNLAQDLYTHALDVLIKIQTCPQNNNRLPTHYTNRCLHTELKLFQTWFLKTHLKINLTDSDNQQLKRLYQLLIDSALNQPQVCVHRDYHSKNLMVLPNNRIGVLDFQDAVWGPITYDLVSLLRDCYITWPPEFIDKNLHEFYNRLQSNSMLTADVTFSTWTRWFDWMGVQRHLKVLGTFTRLHWQYGKSDYLSYLPRIYHYLESTTERYTELSWLENLLKNQIKSHLYLSRTQTMKTL